jgi:hypothetical protein
MLSLISDWIHEHELLIALFGIAGMVVGPIIFFLILGAFTGVLNDKPSPWND